MKKNLFRDLNDMMARMAELYIENNFDSDYLDSIAVDEPILIDYAALSDEDMRELFMCAAMSLNFESDDSRTDLLLS